MTIASFGEQTDGRVTLTVTVSGEFNLTMFNRQVFGINPDDLEPCDVPGPQEALGAVMSPDDVAANIDSLRVSVRPDLWEMGDDGYAKWKGDPDRDPSLATDTE